MINKRILSLGAGVQSTDLLLRALRGEFDHKPDYAIFSDTGNEPKGVYKHLAWLTDYVRKHYAFEIVVTSKGDIYHDALNYVNGITSRSDGIPFHLRGENGEKGILRRQCTYGYKIQPIRKYIKKDKLPGRQNRIELWLGISYDERQRMKEPEVKWLTHRYPLVEKRLTRADCLANFETHNLPKPSRSSCAICPYHSNEYWAWLKDSDPQAFNDAVRFDEQIRRYPQIKSNCFLHWKGIPLKEAVDQYIQEKQQDELAHLPELIDECDGICGV